MVKNPPGPNSTGGQFLRNWAPTLSNFSGIGQGGVNSGSCNSACRITGLNFFKFFCDFVGFFCDSDRANLLFTSYFGDIFAFWPDSGVGGGPRLGIRPRRILR